MSTPTPPTPAAAPAAAPTPPPATPAPAVQPMTHRAAFDELVRRRMVALVTKARQSDPADQRVLEDAQLLEATAREFADAVDRDGRSLDYADAVFISGSSSPLVVPFVDYDRTPFYWQAFAGEVDGVTIGGELVEKLTGE